MAPHLGLNTNAVVAAATQLGFPVAVKLYFETITHKTEVNGVHLDVRNATGLRQAWRTVEKGARAHADDGNFLGVTVQRMIPPGGYELILGRSIDPPLGPVLLFGAGGNSSKSSATTLSDFCL